MSPTREDYIMMGPAVLVRRIEELEAALDETLHVDAVLGRRIAQLEDGIKRARGALSSSHPPCRDADAILSKLVEDF